MNIENFKVYGLHGKLNYDIRFENNSLILVAENGSGKTTLVNMFYYFLSRQWRKLNEYQFEKITIRINSKDFSFDKKNFKEILLRDSKMSKRFPSRYSRIAEEIISKYNIIELRRNPEVMERIANQYDVPLGLINEIIMMYRDEEHRIEKDNRVQQLEELLNLEFKNTQIVYLPTYRRIEKDLKNIFPHLEESMKEYEYKKRRRSLIAESPDYVELVEFGMDDVKERVERRCSELKGYFYNNLSGKITGSYLEDILNKRYKSFDSEKIQSFNDDALMYLLKRLDDSIISTEGKNELKKFVEKVREEGAIGDEDKINAYFVWKLFQIYEEQQNAELDINRFVNICNDYIKEGKHFHYDNDTFKVDIFLDDELKQTIIPVEKDILEKLKEEKAMIEYKDLSSGEKQIVSLFSHLILSKKDYFIIIDEPELSLSVPWQERLLPDIINSGGCQGILAVTHSPFIFKNDMKQYSHSLEEFLIK
ncbi:MAG: AAA family ATPase [Paludibacter sp.]|nr:AAA family ATPase [Paludibacter sp.]